MIRLGAKLNTYSKTTDIFMTTKKRSKKDLKEILADMSDPDKVLASPDIITASELLQVSYEMGGVSIPRKNEH